MSRLGKLPIQLPEKVQVSIEKGFVVAKGPKGELKRSLHEFIQLELKDKEIVVSVKNQENKEEKSMWGLWRALIQNMVTGVNDGFQKKLEINGVGFRAAVSGNKLTLNLGFSHPVEYPLPVGISAVVEGNAIILSGIDKEVLGETAARIRALKKPEPYQGKGIKYSYETIRRKAGKTAAK
jgi:large subunit ribosomal protein L6